MLIRFQIISWCSMFAVLPFSILLLPYVHVKKKKL